MRLTLARFQTLVSIKWLHKRLGKPSSNLRVLDASATHDRNVDGYAEFYLKSHIPLASYFHLHKLCPNSPTSLEQYPVPDLNRFQDYAETLGVSADTHVVAYDRSNTTFALKTWWLFRLFGHSNVSVLDGGFNKWQADGFETTSEEPVIEKSDFQAVYRPSLVHNFDNMVENLKTREKLVVDSRTHSDFYNKGQEKTGHIPGSRNLPYSQLLQEDGTFKSPDDLKKAFEAAGVDLSRPMVFTCQRGMTACGLAAAVRLLGNENELPVYNGSYQEWGSRAGPDQIKSD